ncbi:hypothetical protein CBL_08026 [Carabus blaptoides fortunei]
MRKERRNGMYCSVFQQQECEQDRQGCLQGANEMTTHSEHSCSAAESKESKCTTRNNINSRVRGTRDTSASRPIADRRLLASDLEQRDALAVATYVAKRPAFTWATLHATQNCGIFQICSTKPQSNYFAETSWNTNKVRGHGVNFPGNTGARRPVCPVRMVGMVTGVNDQQNGQGRVEGVQTRVQLPGHVELRAMSGGR